MEPRKDWQMSTQLGLRNIHRGETERKGKEANSWAGFPGVLTQASEGNLLTMKAAVRDLVVGAEDNKAELQSCKHTLSVPPRARPPGPGGGAGWGGGGGEEEEGSTTGSGLGGGSRCWGRVGEAVTETRTQESNFSRFHLLHINMGNREGWRGEGPAQLGRMGCSGPPLIFFSFSPASQMVKRPAQRQWWASAECQLFVWSWVHV